MQPDPDVSQFGHSLFLQVGVLQGETHEALLTHPLIPFAAATSPIDLAEGDPQLDEVAPPRHWSLPLFTIIESGYSVADFELI